MKKIQLLSIAEGRRLGAEFPVGIVGPCCGEVVGPRGKTFTCTRPAGHQGQHVTHVPGSLLFEAVATWQQAAAVVERGSVVRRSRAR